MSEDAGEKQHKPSARRLDKLKKEGTFLRAKEFSSGVSLLAGVTLLLLLSPYFMGVLKHNFVSVFTQLDRVAHHESAAYALYKQLAFNNFLLVLPIGVILAVVVVTATFLLGGFGFSVSLLHFKADRLSPMKNLKRIFSFQQVIEVMKSVLKFTLFLGVLAFFLYKESAAIFHLSVVHRANSLTEAYQIIRLFFMYMMLPILILALIDMLYHYVSHNKKVKMTSQEVKDEQKDSDGSPEMKRKIRAAQQALVRRSVQLAVPQATVIITNPSHYAIALRYNETKDKAPKIMAKGMDHMAAEIRLLAIKNSIPIYEAPQLARAIYFTGKVGTYIHQDLYKAVAIVLAYVVQLKNYQRGLAEKPNYAKELIIPESFHF
ncbi:MAG: flagellar biosynthesis protein FlhB [Legionellales bacterium]